MSVVLPDDSGPKISTMRPRGKPPTPSARSSDSAPDGMADTLTAASSSPMRMIEPLPNWRSIWVSALPRRDVLVQPEEVLRVVASLQSPQPVVLLRPVGLPHALVSLLHEEVHVHARVVRLERGPEV